MTTKVAPPAPLDQKALDYSSKEEIKASAISGNDEPTNSSSAGSHHPSLTSSRVPKLPPSVSGQEEEVEVASEPHLNGSKTG